MLTTWGHGVKADVLSCWTRDPRSNPAQRLSLYPNLPKKSIFQKHHIFTNWTILNIWKIFLVMCISNFALPLPPPRTSQVMSPGSPPRDFPRGDPEDSTYPEDSTCAGGGGGGQNLKYTLQKKFFKCLKWSNSWKYGVSEKSIFWANFEKVLVFLVDRLYC